MIKSYFTCSFSCMSSFGDIDTLSYFYIRYPDIDQDCDNDTKDPLLGFRFTIKHTKS